MKTAEDIRATKGQSKIAMLTVYDYPTACALDRCGLDILFVGDTLGEVELGFERTSKVTMEMMLHHLGAVRRGVKETHLLADLPYGSYAAPEQALENARQLLEAGANSVKLEGPRYDVVEYLVAHGVDVMGHVGLLPQTAQRYVRQGTRKSSAARVESEAVGLARAGCYAVVLEYVPTELAQRITPAIPAPTVGIGAGPHCDGQVLVITDMLGLFPRVPSYVRKYAHLYEAIVQAGEAFRDEVKEGLFPSGGSEEAVKS
jgi:3-methyl-2-oxobutanoate hydroxymethyltransferase